MKKFIFIIVLNTFLFSSGSVYMSIDVQGAYDYHSDFLDVNTKNNCSRFLAFFLYLTNNKEGSTIFTKHDVSSSCTKGSLLIFPPNWIYLHSGEKCVETNKYIVGSYAHYIK